MAEVPDSIPILSRGKHQRPSRGACFMEYTALLAGEPFSDHPACVDARLAGVLRRANDLLSDEHRWRLVPLLGRAVGLALPRPVDVGEGLPRRAARKARAEEQERYLHAAAQLHRAVCRRFLAGVGFAPVGRSWRASAHDGEVGTLFWDLLVQPGPVATPAEYVSRLVARLDLLHECYEQAMADVGLARVPVVVRDPTEAFLPVTAARS